MQAGYGTHPDYTAFDVEFSHPRLFNHEIGLVLSHSQRSDGHESVVTLGNPFRALSSAFGATLTFHEFDGQVRRFFEGPVGVE